MINRTKNLKHLNVSPSTFGLSPLETIFLIQAVPLFSFIGVPMEFLIIPAVLIWVILVVLKKMIQPAYFRHFTYRFNAVEKFHYFINHEEDKNEHI